MKKHSIPLVLIVTITIGINLWFGMPPRHEFQVILHNPFLSQDMRLRLKMGSPLYEYVKFLQSNLPKNTTIALPPYSATWHPYGDQLYMNYFLYPRKTIATQDIGTAPSLQADYALVVRSSKDVLWPADKKMLSTATYIQTQPELGFVKLK